MVDDSRQLLAKRHITDSPMTRPATRSCWTCSPSMATPRRTRSPSRSRPPAAVLRTGKRKVFAINPMAAARYRDRHSVSRKKSDHGDALVLANILRTVTSLDAHQTGPADLAAAIRGHWGMENSSHHISDVTFAEDASTVHTGTAPRAMAAFRNLAIGVLKTLGADNMAKTTRAIRDEPKRALPILGITNNPDAYGT
ncbi:IS110 family transposase [Actinacidiphila glaucinigra]